MDPLAQLQDITTPEPISQFPMAIGWWILLALIFLIIVVLIRQFIKYQALRKTQKLAMKQISKNSPNLAETIRILKTTAMAYLPRNEIAALSGQQLADYLTNKLPEKNQQAFIDNSVNVWQQLYQKDASEQIDNNFNQAAIHWLKNALPPKKLNTVTNKTGGQS
jgi:ABC-type anion transport system duplicated permease subunit